MAGAHRRKKRQSQKKIKQKQKKQLQPQKKQPRRKGSSSQVKPPSKEFVPKMLQNLCHGKGPLTAKANEKAIFTQRCFVATQDGQQQCFLSNYMSSEAMTGAGSSSSSSVAPAIVWPCKPAMAKWPVAMYPSQPSSLGSSQWQDGQQRCIISNGVPSPGVSGRMAGTLGTITTKDVQYEVNEIVPRQIMPCVFARDPSTPPF